MMNKYNIHPTIRKKNYPKEYETWLDMKKRCYNPKHKDYLHYGKRGIIVCQRWISSFSNFFIDMGEKPLNKSLDRKNVNGNYEPNNCRWATSEQQAQNKRNNVLLTLDGVTKIAEIWSRELGIGSATLLRRYRNGDRTKTSITQNKRLKYITYNGMTKTIKEWSVFLKIPATTLYQRFNKGLPLFPSEAKMK